MTLTAWILLVALLGVVLVALPIAYFAGMATGAHRLRDHLIVTAAKEKNAELARLLDRDLEAVKDGAGATPEVTHG